MSEAVAPRYNVPIQKIPPKVGAFVGKASLERGACDRPYVMYLVPFCGDHFSARRLRWRS